MKKKLHVATLKPAELKRYNRQMIIPSFGKQAQLKLKRARVVVAGVGGLGSSSSIYLTVAGVGYLRIIDEQLVELTNLNRQVLHWEADIDRSKIESAVEKLRAINPNVKVEGEQKRITRENVDELLRGADIVIDGMDNYPTRFLLNEACVRLGIPFIHAAVEGLVGQLVTIVPGKSPCLRCFIPKEPPTRPVFPVLGATPGVMGCLQAMEAIKLITKIGKPLVGRMLVFNGKDMSFDEIKLERNLNCPVCRRRKEM